MQKILYIRTKLLLFVAAWAALTGCESYSIFDTQSSGGDTKCALVENFSKLSNVKEVDKIIYGSVIARCGALLHTSISTIDNDAFKKTLLLILADVYNTDSETKISLADDLADAKVLALMQVTQATALSPPIKIDDTPAILDGKLQLAIFRDQTASLVKKAPVFEYVIGIYEKDDKNYLSVFSDVETFEQDEEAVIIYPEHFGTYQLISTTKQAESGDFLIE